MRMGLLLPFDDVVKQFPIGHVLSHEKQTLFRLDYLVQQDQRGVQD